jgi:drug/metabolite transporter (DMT)-like permease
MTAQSSPSSFRVALALLAVYLVWGSTFLAILFAIDTLPPFTMAGTRFTIAGGLLYGFTRFRGSPRPTRPEWAGALVVGALLLGVGNGGVTWAEQHVSSGAAALFMASIPAWMVLLDWLRPRGRVPGVQELLGVGLGMAGIVLLVGITAGAALERGHPAATPVLVVSAFAWALGSIASRSLPVPRSALQLTAMQMLMGGFLLLIGGGLAGEWGRLDPGAVSLKSLLALGYLVVFGSLLGFTAYVWLLRWATPAVASSYAFVNPAIAVGLGWLLAGEQVGRSTLVAMGVIVVGVALIVLSVRNVPRPVRTAASAYPGGVADAANPAPTVTGPPGGPPVEDEASELPARPRVSRST